jgi:acyl carrier protein
MTDATTSTALLPRIREIVATALGLQPHQVEPQHTLCGEVLGCDTLDVAEILCALEAEYDIDITDEEAGEDPTVARLAEIVAAKAARR